MGYVSVTGNVYCVYVFCGGGGGGGGNGRGRGRREERREIRCLRGCVLGSVTAWGCSGPREELAHCL